MKSITSNFPNSTQTISLLVLSNVFLISNLFGQDPKWSQEINVIPPSPNVTSFQKYIDSPISLYTGTPDVSVPIYTLSTPQLTLPISLTYNASGLKVDERASWVGAGFSLNAGGAVSRTAKGFPDELNDAESQAVVDIKQLKVQGSGSHFIPLGMDEVVVNRVDEDELRIFLPVKWRMYVVRGDVKVPPRIVRFDFMHGVKA